MISFWKNRQKQCEGEIAATRAKVSRRAECIARQKKAEAERKEDQERLQKVRSRLEVLQSDRKRWKEQEEKKLRELGVSEEVIAELRDYDWNCFKQERNYKNHQMPDTDFIERTEDASGKWEIQQPVNVQDFIKSLDDNKLRKELQKLDQVTLYIILLKTFGYGTEEIGKLLGMKANTVSARMKRLRKKLKKYFF